MNRQNNIKTGLLILVVFAIFIFSSCKNDSTVEPADLSHYYFPYEQGLWIHYDVDSTVWDDFTSDSAIYNYQIKEYVESYFIDDEGNDAMRLERHFRDSDTIEWSISDIWFMNIKTTSAEKVEENVRFVKLIFPVKKNKSWDGNIYNYLPEQNYKYEETHIPYAINTIELDSVVIVRQANETSLVNEIQKYEVYAKDIGMVEKYSLDVEKDIITQTIVKGTEYHYKIRAYGK